MEKVDQNTIVNESNNNLAAGDVYVQASSLLFNERLDREDVVIELKKYGLNEALANVVINNLLAEHEEKKSRAKKDILYGGLWFFGGLIVTAVTYSNASGGGSYMVAWGAILFGGIQFFRGVFSLNN